MHAASECIHATELNGNGEAFHRARLRSSVNEHKQTEQRKWEPFLSLAAVPSRRHERFFSLSETSIRAGNK
jgi:hypothetical protein